MLNLYNTLSRKVEEFKPFNPPTVTYYSCGPTVYDFAHIGHARTFIFADILQRVLKFDGFEVKRVMNITDVGHLTSDSDEGEDKMELASLRSGKGAVREKKTVWEIAKFYTDDFFEMTGKLNIIKPEIICKATDYIPQMIKLVETLEKKGFTYLIEDGVYFDTSKFPQYGILTGLDFEKLQKSLKAGARIEIVAGKKNPTDFALWKLTPKGVTRQMEWDSPWGKGFPGWHIECSAMSMEFLGKTIDVHTGGVDHIPIHHTNEIAQSEAANDKQFVRFWLHADHLLIDGAKMSKSLGNFYRLKDIEAKGFSPMDLRYLFLTASYRTQMNFTWISLEGAHKAYGNLCNEISSIKNEALEGKERVSLSQDKMEKIDQFREKFTIAINGDLNIPLAVGITWEVLKSNIPPNDKYDLILLFDEVLGLELAQITDNKKQITEIPQEIIDLKNKRETLRNEKKWQEADIMRQNIEAKGYLIKDSSTGTQVVKK